MPADLFTCQRLWQNALAGLPHSSATPKPRLWANLGRGFFDPEEVALPMIDDNLLFRIACKRPDEPDHGPPHARRQIVEQQPGLDGGGGHLR